MTMLDTSGAAPRIGFLRLITIVLLVGPCLMGAVFFMLRGSLDTTFVEVPYLSVGCGALAVVLYASAFASRKLVWRHARAQTEARAKFAAYGSGAIIFFALLEGGMMPNLVMILLIADPGLNVFMAAVGVVLGVVSLPSAEQCVDVTL